jgi:hypothetical protein
MGGLEAGEGREQRLEVREARGQRPEVRGGCRLEARG